MNHINIEIKARCSNKEQIRKILKNKSADFKGIDRQIDTYYKVKKGRLKLREGNIENCLIYYDREDISGPKKSDVILFPVQKNSSLKQIFLNSFEILVRVKKTREIYFIDNIKFHLDGVENLGNFVEIEAIDKNGKIGAKTLLKQCQEYLNLFKIKEQDLIENSYNDMLLENELQIKPGTINEVVLLSKQIPEFDKPYENSEYKKRFENTKHLILIAYYFEKPVGFKVGYQIEDYFYTWMGGVLPNFRNRNIAKKLAQKQEEWIKENSFVKMKLKIRNKHKSMLHFALSNGFKIISLEPNKNKEESRIILEKKVD
ncbi:MAG: GNAT family N-acetyltransferase [Armatimonadetes bacterium]|nr:GNAT family N-acetyltransferase [Armatimonadota bacterium]